jgi:hypothetical protein
MTGVRRTTAGHAIGRLPSVKVYDCGSLRTDSAAVNARGHTKRLAAQLTRYFQRPLKTESSVGREFATIVGSRLRARKMVEFTDTAHLSSVGTQLASLCSVVHLPSRGGYVVIVFVVTSRWRPCIFTTHTMSHDNSDENFSCRTVNWHQRIKSRRRRRNERQQELSSSTVMSVNGSLNYSRIALVPTRHHGDGQTFRSSSSSSCLSLNGSVERAGVASPSPNSCLSATMTTYSNGALLCRERGAGTACGPTTICRRSRRRSVPPSARAPAANRPPLKPSARSCDIDRLKHTALRLEPHMLQNWARKSERPMPG